MSTWNAASAGALSITKYPEIPRNDPDIKSAEWTTLRLNTTPSAETSVIPARKTNATVKPRRPFRLQDALRSWELSWRWLFSSFSRWAWGLPSDLREVHRTAWRAP